MSDGKEDRAPAWPLKGQYANYCRVGQNATEFVIDFGQSYGDSEEPVFHTRIITTPLHMKAIVEAFQQAIAVFTRRFPESPDGM